MEGWKFMPSMRGDAQGFLLPMLWLERTAPLMS